MLTSKLPKRCAVALVLLAACAHREPPPPQVPPPRQAVAPNAERSNAPPSTVNADDGGMIESAMFEHFMIANYARDAVIRGRLGLARRALVALADFSFEGGTPAEWKPWIEKVQVAAKSGARATTLEDAAAAVANVAAICGECHKAQGAGPGFPDDYDPEVELGLSNSLIDRMERHVWSANRMWEGLIGPSESAWYVGGAELAKAPLKPPRRKSALSSEFGADLRALRELGDQARSTTETAARAKLYTRFLVRCAQCHEREHVTI